MLEYVIIDHPNLGEKKQAFKFPNVGADMLSIPNSKILDFFSLEDANEDLPNFDYLFSPLFNKDGSISEAELNYTRAGYLHKIINNLLNNKPAIFMTYLFKHKSFISALLKHSYSKSIALILQNLCIMSQNSSTPASQPTNTNTGEQKIEANAVVQNPVVDIVRDTLKDRLELFEEIVKESINSSDKESEIDTNANLSNIVMFILTKEFSERLNFLQKFIEHLDMVVLKFTSTFFTSVNNKLGNIFLVFLEIFFKENDKDIIDLNFPLYKIENYSTLYFEILQKKQTHVSPLTYRSERTLSFSTEILPVNIKLYKVLEALLMIIKHYANFLDFDQAIFLQSKLENDIFSLMTDHPFNNILHNQIKKYLISVVESKSETLQDLYFTKNPQFFKFLTSVEGSRIVSPNKKKIKMGFVGHLVSLVNSILKNEVLSKKLSEEESWTSFLKTFFEEENQLEKIVLGDVDIKTDDSEQSEPVFYFSLDEIKKKFTEFLDLSDEIETPEVEDQANTSEDKVDGVSEENRSSENEHPEATNTPDLLQEIKDLDDHNPESSFVDFNYWKPLIDYRVDDLLNELKN